MQFTKWLAGLMDIGTRHHTDPTLKQRIRIMNLLALTALVSLVFYIPIEVYLGLEEGVVVNGVLQVFSLLSLVLVHRGYYYLPLRFISAVFVLYFPFAAVFYGDGFGVEFLLIVTAINSFLFFDGAERFLWFALACITFLVSDYLQRIIPPYPHGAQPTVFYWLNISIVFGVVGAAINYFKTSIYQYLNIIQEQSHQLAEANEELQTTLGALNQAHEEVKATLELVSEQKEVIAAASTKVMESIHYAQRIQFALLPLGEFRTRVLPQSFVYFKPKDIVSGDCFFLAQCGNQCIVAAIDCTGHGVPGAFMSVLAISLLGGIVKEAAGPLQPAEILGQMDAQVRLALHQDEGSAALDGMDIALLVLERVAAGGHYQLGRYAGAGRPLCLLDSATGWTELAGNRHAVGGRSAEAKEFSEMQISLQPGQWLFLFSDGITDQFGGAQGRKYSRQRLRDFLTPHLHTPPDALLSAFSTEMASWQGSRPQLDDQLLLGIRI